VLDAVLGGFDRPLTAGVVVVGGLLFMGHLVVAMQQSWAASQALRAATERAHAERLSAERASAAKSDFLATVSHEIRTPMNAVVSAGNLLRRTELTPRQSEHVAMLENASEVLIGLLTDVLDISKIEAGRMSLELADLPAPRQAGALVEQWKTSSGCQGREPVAEHGRRRPRDGQD
jgi:signal transduction histidine kinase